MNGTSVTEQSTTSQASNKQASDVQADAPSSVPGEPNRESSSTTSDSSESQTQPKTEPTPEPQADPKTAPQPEESEPEPQPAISFQGQVLAGSSSPLLEFNQADYQTALASNRLIVLYYYANWCPNCIAEFPKMQAAFNGLSGDDVVGFRVSFNDNETTDAEEDLARQHGVAYQHTKVFVKNGSRILKSPESWEQSRYEGEIGAQL